MTGRFTPLIPRDLRLEVPERLDARGRVLTPLDEAATRTATVAAVQIRGESPSLLPGITFTVSVASELPVERLTRPGQP